MSDELNFDPSNDHYDWLSQEYRQRVGIWLTTAKPNDRFGMPAIEGPVVYRVVPNGAAEAAGLMKGDIILEVDGTPSAELPGGSTDLIGAVIQYINSTFGRSNLTLRVRRGKDELLFNLAI